MGRTQLPDPESREISSLRTALLGSEEWCLLYTGYSEGHQHACHAGYPGLCGTYRPCGSTLRLSLLNFRDNSFKITEDENSTLSLTPTGAVWGRTRVKIAYEDGKVQPVHYFITDSAPTTINKLGELNTTISFSSGFICHNMGLLNPFSSPPRPPSLNLRTQ
ncbi:hypothetical protein N7457_000715 [Penicillium paradoxum]|uniref:uncharacterized protein n=1 Tax=Penicillium paradoxum TaxID=176176 RepID=UPI002549240B|nr:uncharacterized protein N7457_000715 [Penicillium paradoxum]KAJ5794116.1 hypothetical protein N7457_000715 [Penicillium paradoxum]